MTDKASFSTFEKFEGAALRVFELVEALREIAEIAETWPIASQHQASGIIGRIRGVALKALGDPAGEIAAVMFSGERYVGKIIDDLPDPENPNFIQIELVAGSKARMAVTGPRADLRTEDVERPRNRKSA